MKSVPLCSILGDRLINRMTQSLYLLHPIILAPMGGISGSNLAVTVANTGGLGFIGTGGQSTSPTKSYISSKNVFTTIADCRRRADDARRLGVGFVVESSLEKDPSILEDIIKLCPSNLWLSYGDFKKYTDILKKHIISDINIFIQVSSVGQAKDAYRAGARAIVLRGQGAGGYGDSSVLPSLEDILPEMRYFLSRSESEGQPSPFLIAAGGISHGKDLVKYLRLGADGICLGTALAASLESDLTDEEKERMVQGMNGRQMIHQNPDGSIAYSGSGIKNISDIKSAKSIIEGIVHQAVLELSTEYDV